MLPPFFNTQGTTFQTCLHPQAAANQHSPQWLSTHTHTHPKAHSQPPNDTHCSHEPEIQQARLLSGTQHPFLLSHPFQSKTAPTKGPVCSPLFITQGGKGRETSCLWKLRGKHPDSCLSFINPYGPHFDTCTVGYTRIGWVQYSHLNIGASGP